MVVREQPRARCKCMGRHEQIIERVSSPARVAGAPGLSLVRFLRRCETQDARGQARASGQRIFRDRQTDRRSSPAETMRDLPSRHRWRAAVKHHTGEWIDLACRDAACVKGRMIKAPRPSLRTRPGSWRGCNRSSRKGRAARK